MLLRSSSRTVIFLLGGLLIAQQRVTLQIKAYHDGENIPFLDARYTEGSEKMAWELLERLLQDSRKPRVTVHRYGEFDEEQEREAIHRLWTLSRKYKAGGHLIYQRTWDPENQPVMEPSKYSQLAYPDSVPPHSGTGRPGGAAGDYIHLLRYPDSLLSSLLQSQPIIPLQAVIRESVISVTLPDSESAPVTVIVSDLIGKVLYKGEAQGPAFSLHIASLPGIVIVEVIGREGRRYRRILIPESR